MVTLQLQQITKIYPSGDVAVDHLDLAVDDGELFVLVGPSGCGKTSVLRMVAGLEDVTSGAILIDGKVVNDLAPQDRNLAMVFQQVALYPHMTVADNIGFPLAMAGVDRVAVDRRVQEVATVLHLEDCLDRKPRHLSGGQQQRVAMGRAIIRDPALFLMDEPMSNLDAKLRSQARADVVRLQRRLGTTTLFVTHDQVEAMAIGDRIGLMRAGRLVQSGPPAELYHRPADVFVAGFIGSPPMSFVEAKVIGTERDLGLAIGGWEVALGPAGIQRCPGLADRIGSSVAVGLRSEALRRDVDGPLVASVESTELLGSEQHVRAVIDARPVHVTAAGIEIGEAPATVHVSVGPHDAVSLWRPFRARLVPEALHVFDLASGRALR